MIDNFVLHCKKITTQKCQIYKELYIHAIANNIQVYIFYCGSFSQGNFQDFFTMKRLRILSYVHVCDIYYLIFFVTATLNGTCYLYSLYSLSRIFSYVILVSHFLLGTCTVFNFSLACLQTWR